MSTFCFSRMTSGWSIFCCLISLAGCSRLDQLSQYEALPHSNLQVDIRHRVARSIREPSSYSGKVQNIKFHAFGRSYELILTSVQSQSLFSPYFSAMSSDKHGRMRRHAVDPNDFLHGQVLEEESSDVRAYWEGSALNAVVYVNTDVLYIEPMKRYNDSSNEDDMIVYKQTDVINIGNVSAKCEGIDAEEYYGLRPKISSFIEAIKSKRRKRQSRVNKVKETSCQLLLVADHLFFNEVCRAQESRCISYLIAAIDSVNKIFKETVWDDPQLVGYGFEIYKILIRTTADKKGFNSAKQYDVPSNLLEAFGSDASLQKEMESVCLAHLFTARRFPTGTLGLAYIANARLHGIGGICSSGLEIGTGYRQVNTGWSSAKNRQGDLIPRAQLDLVTAHELGHNWGSEHDPDTRECSPGGNSGGGNFIMYTYSVEGRSNNNQKFSPCSRRSVGLVLRNKASSCFVVPGHSYCGNNLRERGERCDAGLAGSKDEDPCCTSDCRYRYPHFLCSDANDICCNNCTYAADTVQCADENKLVCRGVAYCLGSNTTCGKQAKLDNGEECLDRGECRKGECVSECQLAEAGLPCLCSGDDSCRVCCRQGNQTCLPLENALHRYLPVGRACRTGFCTSEGKCEGDDSNLVERLWDIIVHINSSTIVAFMRSNIVSTVILLSLIVWIPAACVVNCVDKRKAKKNREVYGLHHRSVARSLVNSNPGINESIDEDDDSVFRDRMGIVDYDDDGNAVYADGSVAYDENSYYEDEESYYDDEEDELSDSHAPLARDECELVNYSDDDRLMEGYSLDDQYTDEAEVTEDDTFLPPHIVLKRATNVY